MSDAAGPTEHGSRTHGHVGAASCLLATAQTPGPAGRAPRPHWGGLWLPPVLGLLRPPADEASRDDSRRVVRGREGRLFMSLICALFSHLGILLNFLIEKIEK